MGIEFKNTITKIDAVITWVDGNDPAHRKKMEPYLEKNNLHINKKFNTRFNQVEEIEYAVKSILKNAPFVRNIFIVTDNQIPKFLLSHNNEFKKIKVIDHKTIFKGYESFLPTFNSVSIETMLYRIPGLSEKFIYFNDDLFLLRKLEPTDFFIENAPIIRAKWESYDIDKWHKVFYQKLLKLLGKKTKDKKYGYKKAQQNIAQILEFKKYLKLDHTPAALRKSTIQSFFEENKDILIENSKHRFRYPSQFMIQSLANHLEVKNKTYILKKDYQLVYFGSYKKPLLWYKQKLSFAKRNANKLFLNMQSLDLCPENKLNYIMKWLKMRFNN